MKMKAYYTKIYMRFRQFAQQKYLSECPVNQKQGILICVNLIVKLRKIPAVLRKLQNKAKKIKMIQKKIYT